jgi:NADH dehydrogenase
VTKAARADVDITIVDRTNHHLFQPLYRRQCPVGGSRTAAAQHHQKQANARTVMAEVTRFDLNAKTVHGVSPDGRLLQRRYDTLVWRPGATHAYFSTTVG